MIYRNPFRMRASDNITLDREFLRLFGPGALDLLSFEKSLWDGIQIIRSSPGGGKTSLLRLFTPTSLLTLYNYRNQEDFKDLYKRLEELEVIDEAGPKILGVLLPCEPSYASLEDLEIDTNRKDRLLFSLINSRLIIASISGLLELKGPSFKRDPSRVTFQNSGDLYLDQRRNTPLSGNDLLSLVKDIEYNVCKYLDSLLPNHQKTAPGHDTIFWDLVQPSNLFVDGKQAIGRSIIMFDDIHKLAKRQRNRLYNLFTDSRPKVGIWISERYQALDPPELLDGAKSGREYNLIDLEKTWKTKPKQFENTVMDIADRRAKIAKDVEIHSLREQLEESLDSSEYNDPFRKAIEGISSRIKNRIGEKTCYDDWIESRKKSSGTPREQAIAWQILEIMIERDLGKKQKRLFDAPIPKEEMEQAEDVVKNAAELFLATEFDLPYYFGAGRLVKLASSNIEQFLRVAGYEFEEIATAYTIKHPTLLTPKRQHQIIKKATDDYWEELINGVAYTMDTRRLVEAIGKFSQSETYRLSASYGAGVTGIGIREGDRDNLSNPQFIKRNPRYRRLQIAMASAIANNLLEPERILQGGDVWMVLYLNRLLCVRFNIPLHYGGWRQKRLDDLQTWLERGFQRQEGRRTR